MSWKSFLYKRKLNTWAPYRGAGIHVTKVADDFSSFDVEMKLTRRNKNVFGIHFGGSLYAMTDAFFGLILERNLGSDYMVLDKAAVIHFKKPGKGKVTAHFNIARERINDIKKHADEEFKVEPHFIVEVRDAAGNVVAEVEKTVYVRRKDKKPIHGYKLQQ